jgi:hypothetical protein
MSFNRWQKLIAANTWNAVVVALLAEGARVAV